MLVEQILYGTNHIRVKAQIWQERVAIAVKALFRPVPLCVPTTEGTLPTENCCPDTCRCPPTDEPPGFQQDLRVLVMKRSNKMLCLDLKIKNDLTSAQKHHYFLNHNLCLSKSIWQ